jgi:AraC-like DNA-binding protein
LKGIQVGADDYITKPFSMKFLMTRIVKLIEQREKLQQKFAREPGLVRPPISITDRDKLFLDKLHHVIEKNIGNAEFSMDLFAQTLGMGRTVFYKKLKSITGYSPNEYLRIIRMKKAAEMLVTTGLNVSEVSYRVGINDPFYFSKCFKTQFGKSPSHYSQDI